MEKLRDVCNSLTPCELFLKESAVCSVKYEQDGYMFKSRY